MSREQFRALIRRPDAADAVARHAFARIREAEQTRFEMTGTFPVAQRLACALLRLRPAVPRTASACRRTSSRG